MFTIINSPKLFHNHYPARVEMGKFTALLWIYKPIKSDPPLDFIRKTSGSAKLTHANKNFPEERGCK